MLKKTSMAVLLVANNALFAGTMGPVCSPGQVTVPCTAAAWEFGAEALYLQPSYSGFGYDGRTISVNRTDAETQYLNSNYRWGWGFMIEGAYHFANGNDLNLNWYHWNRTTNNNEPSSGFSTQNINFIGAVDFSLQPKWDAVNVEFGKHIDLDKSTYIRVLGGVQYAHIENQRDITGVNTLNSSYTASGIPGSSIRHLTYNGFGPRIGADLVYGFNNGLNLYVKAASALLVGPQGFRSSYSAAKIFGDGVKTASGSFTAIVPELEGKLGATYSYSFTQSHVTLDLGWMWINYFSALHGETSFGTTHETNFGVQGPYVGLKWIGNFA